jgi:hypothetical protein
MFQGGCSTFGLHLSLRPILIIHSSYLHPCLSHSNDIITCLIQWCHSPLSWSSDMIIPFQPTSTFPDSNLPPSPIFRCCCLPYGSTFRLPLSLRPILIIPSTNIHPCLSRFNDIITYLLQRCHSPLR